MWVAHFICFASLALSSRSSAADTTSCAQATDGEDENSLLHVVQKLSHSPHVQQAAASAELVGLEHNEEELPSPWDQFADKTAEALPSGNGRVTSFTQLDSSVAVGEGQVPAWLHGAPAEPSVALPDHLARWTDALRVFDRGQPGAADRPPIEDVAGAGGNAAAAHMPQGFNLWSLLFPSSGAGSSAYFGTATKFIVLVGACGGLDAIL